MAGSRHVASVPRNGYTAPAQCDVTMNQFHGQKKTRQEKKKKFQEIGDWSRSRRRNRNFPIVCHICTRCERLASSIGSWLLAQNHRTEWSAHPSASLRRKRWTEREAPVPSSGSWMQTLLLSNSPEIWKAGGEGSNERQQRQAIGRIFLSAMRAALPNHDISVSFSLCGPLALMSCFPIWLIWWFIFPLGWDFWLQLKQQQHLQQQILLQQYQVQQQQLAEQHQKQLQVRNHFTSYKWNQSAGMLSIFSFNYDWCAGIYWIQLNILYH